MTYSQRRALRTGRPEKGRSGIAPALWVCQYTYFKQQEFSWN